MSKKELYEGLIKHMHNAMEEGFFLEASWLAYAILEDRTKRILEVSGARLGNKEKLVEKAKRLRKLAEDSEVLAVYLNDDVAPKLSDQDKKAGKPLPIALLDRLDPWRIKRNALVHKVADGTIEYEDAAEQVEQLASEGVELAVKFAKVGRQVKKHAKRAKEQAA